MSEFDNIPGEAQEPTPNFEDAFSSMESTLESLPEGDFVTLRHEANPPAYVPVYEGEALTIRAAIERRGWTLGSAVNAYVDSAIVALDTVVAPGTVVTLVGNVKGG